MDEATAVHWKLLYRHFLGEVKKNANAISNRHPADIRSRNLGNAKKKQYHMPI
jgi:hypothetical protein